LFCEKPRGDLACNLLLLLLLQSQPARSLAGPGGLSGRRVFAGGFGESYVSGVTEEIAQMNYCIRFRQGEGLSEDEIVVEANSPTEAVVKFCCTTETRLRGSARQHEITSVSATDRPNSSW